MRGTAVFLSLLLLIALTPSVNVAETKTLEAIADSSVEAELPDEIFGDRSWLEIETFLIEYEYGEWGREVIAYVMFDLSDIPSDATIESAELKLFTVAVCEARPVGTHYSPEDAWIEAGITWNNKPSYAETPTDVITISEEDKWYSWDVTSDLKKALGDRSLTEVLKCEDVRDHVNTWIWFTSKDYGLGKEPKLEVSYTVPTPTPSDATLVIMVIVILVIGVIGFSAYAFTKRQKKPTSLNIQIELTEKV